MCWGGGGGGGGGQVWGWSYLKGDMYIKHILNLNHSDGAYALSGQFDGRPKKVIQDLVM